MPQATQPQILAALALAGPCSAQQLARAMALPAKRLGPSLTRLRDDKTQAGKRVYVVEWKRLSSGHQQAIFAVGNEACAIPLPTIAGAVHSRRKIVEASPYLVNSVFNLCEDQSKLCAIVGAIAFKPNSFWEEIGDS